MEQTLMLLNKIGLNDSEAKVYLTLLQNGSISGYEASKLSGISRSKVYLILESLIKKGYIMYTQLEKNNKYSALPIKEIVSKVESETKEVLDLLTDQLENYPQRTNMDDLWHIQSNTNTFEKCKEIMNRTKDELLLQIWSDDLDNLIEELQLLEQKGIKMGIVIFNLNKNQQVPLKKYYQHGMSQAKKLDMSGRWITLVSDNKEVVFGQIINDNIAEVIWSESKPMVLLASEYVRHDIYFYKIATELDEAAREKFDDDLIKIRDIF